MELGRSMEPFRAQNLTTGEWVGFVAWQSGRHLKTWIGSSNLTCPACIMAMGLGKNCLGCWPRFVFCRNLLLYFLLHSPCYIGCGAAERKEFWWVSTLTNWSSKTWGVHWHCSSFGRRNSCLSDELCSPFGPTISWAERLRLWDSFLSQQPAWRGYPVSICQYYQTMPDCYLGECFTKNLSLFQRLKMSKPFRPWIWSFLQETLYEPLHTNETDYGPNVESFFFVWRIGFWLLFLRLLEWCGFFGFQAFCCFRLLWLDCLVAFVFCFHFLLSIVFVSFLWLLGFLWP